ncbi:MAG: alcohol dehydrogenase catalytic domain-containing protein [Sedimentisphaerales bacterium]|nr:alcohol dehydrogenase catalytic domain-containing protein [Sedimentisphaerales bacterium]
MKAMFLTALRQMELRDIPEPVIKKDTDVLLKIGAVGVCGSDVHYYETGRIGSQVVEYPFVVGHECAATVVKTGRAVTRVKTGEQVVVEPSFACHSCDQCKAGREHTCRNVIFLGTPKQMSGCLCEYIVVPQENCFPTHGAFNLEKGAFCEPLSIGIYSVRQANFHKGANIAILGTGPIGFCVLLSAKEKEAGCIYVTDKIDSRLEAARKLGVDYIGNPVKVDIVKEILAAEPLGLDCVFECCGQQSALDQAFDILKPGGQLVIVGIPRQDMISFSADKFRRKEITIKYIRRQNHCVQPAIDLIASGKVNLDFLITHRFKLEQTQNAFDLLTDYRDGIIKAMINMQK